MMTVNEYTINEKTVCFTGEYDEFGQLCTMVIEANHKFLVKQTPVEMINFTLLQYGSNFRGARQSSEAILGKHKMYPIKISAELEIWIFPTKSFKDPGCVWFSLRHIKKAHAAGVHKTQVQLNYHHIFEMNTKKCSFDNKQHKARELRRLMILNRKAPYEIKLEPNIGFRISETEGQNRYKIEGKKVPGTPRNLSNDDLEGHARDVE